MKSSWIVALLGLVGTALMACGSPAGSQPDASIAPVCVPQQSQTCFGPGDCAGTQLCDDDGKSFGTCICGAHGNDASVDASADAPSSDGAPTDGALSPGCVTASIGPAGGLLTHPGGARILVPSGALGLATTLSLCPDDTSVAGAVGPVFQAGPEGQTFLRPVQITIDYDAARIAPGSNLSAVQMRMAPAGSSVFAALQSQVDLGTASATTTHFTQFAPALSAAPVFIDSAPSLLAGTVATPYAQQLQAQGGTPPYSWSVPAGSAPTPGLTLQPGGLLGGTPTVPGNFAFFVGVSDSAGASVQLAVTMTVLPASNPVPSLVAISPTTVAQGSPDRVVTLSGADVAPNAVVLWDGIPLPSTFLGPTQIAATIPTLDLATDGSHQVSITNPPPGGGMSGTVTFTVTAGSINPVPTLVTVQPTQLPISAIDTQITVAGASFVTSSAVLVGSQPIATNVVGSSQLSAIVPAAFLGATGVLPIVVFNPPPGGGLSSVVNVSVGMPPVMPAIQALVPSSAVAGSTTLSLGIQGTGFQSGAQAFFGDVALATTFTSARAVTATVPQGLLANVGNVNVVVVDPGGLVSAAASFAVTAPGDDAGSDAAADATVDATLDASDDGSSSADGADATVSSDDGSVAEASVDDSAAEDASETGPAPGAFGGPCNLGACNDSTMICSSGICELGGGQPCGNSSQCGNGMSCMTTGLCGSMMFCAYVVTNSTTICSVPAGPFGNAGGFTAGTLSTCAPGYICQESLTGSWQHVTALCGYAGAQSPCVPEDIPAGEACDLPAQTFTMHWCMPGLTCSVDPDASVPGSGICQ